MVGIGVGKGDRYFRALRLEHGSAFGCHKRGGFVVQVPGHERLYYSLQRLRKANPEDRPGQE